MVATLTVSDFCVTNFKSNTSYEYAKYLRSITEHMDKEMAAEVTVKARFHQGEDESDGIPEVNNFTDVADSTAAYKRNRTNTVQAKEGMYQPIVSDISPERNTRIH